MVAHSPTSGFNANRSSLFLAWAVSGRYNASSGAVVLPRRRSRGKRVQQRQHGPSAAGRGAREGAGLVRARQHPGNRVGAGAGPAAAAHLGGRVQCQGACEAVLTRDTTP